MSTNTQSANQAFAPLAGGYLPQLNDTTDVGKIATTVNGCKATWGGKVAGWNIVLENPFPDDELVVLTSFAQGSSDGKVKSIALSASPSLGQFAIAVHALTVTAPNDVAVAAGAYNLDFMVFRRPKQR